MTDNRRRSQNRQRRDGAAGGRVVAGKAMEVAREAIEDLGEGPAGEHVGVAMTSPGVAVHRFQPNLPGYRGWEWHVVVAVAEGSKYITVSEVALVPGDTALQAPEWIPYEDRVRPGDLGPRDLMPPAPDDERLTPGEPNVRELTEQGKRAADARWKSGETGPHSEFAVNSLLNCGSCAFHIPLSGTLGRDWGVCVNEWAFDGSVVHHGHGCGAHSATPEVVGHGVSDKQAFDDQEIVERTDLN